MLVFRLLEFKLLLLKYLAKLARLIFCWLPKLGPVLEFGSKVHSGWILLSPSSMVGLCNDVSDSGCMRVFGGCQCALPIRAWSSLQQIHSPISILNDQSQFLIFTLDIQFSLLNLIACRFTGFSSLEWAPKDTCLPNNEV